MERGSDRRFHSPKEHRYRNVGGIFERVAARAAVDALRLEINRQTPQQLVKDISVKTLVNHYRQHELPDVFIATKPAPNAGEKNANRMPRR